MTDPLAFLGDFRRGVERALESRDQEAMQHSLSAFADLVGRLLDLLGDFPLGDEPRALAAVYRREISVLHEAYVAIVRRAFELELGPREFVPVLYVPWAIAARVLPVGQVAIADRFLRGLERALVHWAQSLPPESRSLVEDRLARRPAEFLRFQVGPALEGSEPEQADRSIALSRIVLRHLSHLAQAAAENRNLGLFRELVVAIGLPDLRGMDYRPSPGQGSTPFHRRMYDLQVARVVALVGLAGWVRESLALDAKNDREELFHALRIACPCEFLLIGFVEARRFEVQDQMGWDDWLMANVPDFQAVNIDFGSYLISGLVTLLCRCNHVDLIRPTQLDEVRAVRQILEEGATIWDELDRREHETGDPCADEIAIVRESLQTIRSWTDDRWYDLVGTTPVEEERLQAYVADVISGWREAGALKAWFSRRGLVEERAEDADTFQRSAWWGLHLLLPREWFLPGSNVALSFHAKGLGQNVAQISAQRVWEDCLASFPATRVSTSGVASEVTALVRKNSKASVLVVNWPEAFSELSASDGFEWDHSGQAIGHLEGGAVFQVFTGRDSAPGILVAKDNRFATWLQWRPHLPDDDLDLWDTTLKGRLRAIDEADAETFASESQEVGQEHFLRHVRLQVYARTALRVDDQDGGHLVIPETE